MPHGQHLSRDAEACADRDNGAHLVQQLQAAFAAEGGSATSTSDASSEGYSGMQRRCSYDGLEVAASSAHVRLDPPTSSVDMQVKVRQLPRAPEPSAATAGFKPTLPLSASCRRQGNSPAHLRLAGATKPRRGQQNQGSKASARPKSEQALQL